MIINENGIDREMTPQEISKINEENNISIETFENNFQINNEPVEEESEVE